MRKTLFQRAKDSFVLGGAVTLGSLLASSSGCNSIYNGVGGNSGAKPVESEPNDKPSLRLYESDGTEIRPVDFDPELAERNGWDEAFMVPLDRGEQRDLRVEAEDTDGPQPLTTNFYALSSPFSVDLDRGDQTESRQDWYLTLDASSSTVQTGTYKVAEGTARDGVNTRRVGFIGVVGDWASQDDLDAVQDQADSNSNQIDDVQDQVDNLGDDLDDHLDDFNDHVGDFDDHVGTDGPHHDHDDPWNGSDDCGDLPETSFRYECTTVGGVQGRQRIGTEYFCDNGKADSSDFDDGQFQPTPQSQLESVVCDVSTGTLNQNEVTYHCENGEFVRTTTTNSDPCTYSCQEGASSCNTLEGLESRIQVMITDTNGVTVNNDIITDGGVHEYAAQVTAPTAYVNLFGPPSIALSESIGTDDDGFGLVFQENQGNPGAPLRVLSSDSNSTTYEKFFDGGRDFGIDLNYNTVRIDAVAEFSTGYQAGDNLILDTASE